MINEIELWKEELVKIAHKLLKRLYQKRWSNRSVFNLEKEIFLGFFSVRKLIESHGVSSEIGNQIFELLHFPKRNLDNDEIDTNLLYEPAPEKSKKRVTVREICNQFIHSFHVMPFGANGILYGFFINSEFHSKKGIYLISLFVTVHSSK